MNAHVCASLTRFSSAIPGPARAACLLPLQPISRTRRTTGEAAAGPEVALSCGLPV